MLLRRLRYSASKWVDAFHSFVSQNVEMEKRTFNIKKERKYKNLQITEQFKKQQQLRKKIRIDHLKARKSYLEKKLNAESKLLTFNQTTQLTDITDQLASLEQILEQQDKKLQQIDQKLENTEPEYMLCEGLLKIVVLNHIEYLRHMNRHPSGFNLHPETIKIIENVHYLVNNNLPVHRYKMFELMPSIFKKQINELDDSMRRLIQEKQLDPESDPSSRIRFFVRHKSRHLDIEQEVVDLTQEENVVYENIALEFMRRLQPHSSCLEEIGSGRTPFRSLDHFLTVILSNKLQVMLLPEEEALKTTVLELMQLRKQLTEYKKVNRMKIYQAKTRYIQPPKYIKNHPVLSKLYEQLMVKRMNPVPIEKTGLLPQREPDDGGASFYRKHLRQIAAEKYDNVFVEMMNNGRREQLTAMKETMKTQFLIDSNIVYEQYQELIESKKQQEEFKKLPKDLRRLRNNETVKLTFEDITKSLLLNSQQPDKYNIQFFAQYFGLQDVQQARKLFETFSYMQILPERKGLEETFNLKLLKMG